MASDRIRIMFVIGSMGHSRAGTERNLLTIIEHLDRTRFEPFLVSLQDCEYIQQGRFCCDTTCLYLYRMFTPTMWSKRRQLAQRMRELGIDIVQTFFVEGHLVGGAAAEMAGVKAIVSSRRNLGYSYSLKEKLLLKYANRYPRRWLANSQAVADTISRLEAIDRSRFDVIYNGVEISTPDTAATTAPVTPNQTVIMIANFRPVKAVDTLIRAAAVVVKSVPKVRFAIVGDGPQRTSLLKLAAELSLTGQIDFMGSTSDVSTALRGATVGVLTSTSEGFSNAILEYMSAGLPVVATDVGGNREAVLDGKTGFLIAPTDQDALATKLIYLLTHPDESLRLGRAGRGRAETEFSLAVMIRNYQEYYIKLVKQFRSE
jgi:glycosyltransferase involved in cell wall biosynthesis